MTGVQTCALPICYAQIAVDDFVRQLGDRLEVLQRQVDQQQARADKLTRDLEAANTNLVAYAEREMAIANALVAAEQQRVVVQQHLEVEQLNAQIQVDQMLADARSEAELLVNEARQNAEAITADAEATRIAQEERIRALCAEYDETITRVRRALENELSLLPAPGTVLAGLPVAEAAVAAAALESVANP